MARNAQVLIHEQPVIEDSNDAENSSQCFSEFHETAIRQSMFVKCTCIATCQSGKPPLQLHAASLYHETPSPHRIGVPNCMPHQLTFADMAQALNQRTNPPKASSCPMSGSLPHVIDRGSGANHQPCCHLRGVVRSPCKSVSSVASISE